MYYTTRLLTALTACILSIPRPPPQAVFGGAHSFARSQLLPFVDRGEMNSMLAETLAGGIGGGFQGLVLSPTLLLKTRVMTDPIFRQNMGLVETSRQSARVGINVIRNEGVAALMKGSITFSLKRVADWSVSPYACVLFPPRKENSPTSTPQQVLPLPVRRDGRGACLQEGRPGAF